MTPCIWTPAWTWVDTPLDLAKDAHRKWYRIGTDIFRARRMRGIRMRLEPDPSSDVLPLFMDIHDLWQDPLPTPRDKSRWTHTKDLDTCVVLRRTTRSVYLSRNGHPSKWSRWRFLAEWDPCETATAWDIVRHDGLRELTGSNTVHR